MTLSIIHLSLSSNNDLYSLNMKNVVQEKLRLNVCVCSFESDLREAKSL